MKRKIIFGLSTALLLALTSCGGGADSSSVSDSTSFSSESSSNQDSSSSSSTSSTGGQSSNSSTSSAYTSQEIEEYLQELSETSEADHLYYHYRRHDNQPSSYSDWDVWAFQNAPRSGEGAKFDWVGRTTSSDKLSATGDAVVDPIGGAYIDIDLTETYDGGWDASTRTIGGDVVSYMHNNEICTRIGLQIVKSSTRVSGSGFWTNDGGDLRVALADYAFANADGSTSYHVFVSEDNVQSPSPLPSVEIEDPFANDDGTNVTYGDSRYDNVDWNQEEALAETSPLFLKGESETPVNYLENGAGVGYQIMVSSFADSDGDGFGDIYGITQKLDYIQELGVNVLWLTPIQLSDSYHGYDISDYTQVDPKFGSSVSPNALSGGRVTSATAMEDYKDLLDGAHERGMAVIMDLVLNHTSTSNNWFIRSAQLDEEYRGYYQWGNHETNSTNINEDKFWYPYGSHPYSYYAKFGSSMPELNFSYIPTREAVVSMAKTWCSIGVDGFRVDAVKHIYMNDEVEADSGDTIINDRSTNSEGERQDYSSNLTKNLNFWRYFNSEVKKDYPNCFLVGENFDGHAYHVAPFYEGFDSLFDFYSYFNLTSAAAHARNGSIGTAVAWWSGISGAYGSMYDPDSEIGGDAGISGSTEALRYNGNWDLYHVMRSYNQYRTGGDLPTDDEGFSTLMGSFTSNHDIARCINRVAGTGDSSGIQAQGNLTPTNYDSYLQSATLVEIAELMLPGLTWIYYGDELGMTGNFKEGQNGNSDYADLAYRQPMKWVEDGAVGDGSMTTGYGVTGSGVAVEWDEINASSLVVSADEAATSEHYLAIQDFATLKSASQTLIRGNYVAYDWKVNNQQVDYVFNFQRTLGAESYSIVINFSPTATLDAGFTGEVAASYNGATLTRIPPLSAIAIKL